ncbi:hypothetical protein BDV95DRAFT_597795 [Massariosphaeria phaeospora]|uniref:Uncharacterized protein n=1 Tax=Massariosphaeria phaeospora TaxID=100035 RepID=A0A7C8I585_9PLEO|nr:hypothetical protein BDV95DRAFT_597795 [Massariosphaeria phaeospora]
MRRSSISTKARSLAGYTDVVPRGDGQAAGLVRSSTAARLGVERVVCPSRVSFISAPACRGRRRSVSESKSASVRRGSGYKVARHGAATAADDGRRSKPRARLLCAESGSWRSLGAFPRKARAGPGGSATPITGVTARRLPPAVDRSTPPPRRSGSIWLQVNQSPLSARRAVQPGPMRASRRDEGNGSMAGSKHEHAHQDPPPQHPAPAAPAPAPAPTLAHRRPVQLACWPAAACLGIWDALLRGRAALQVQTLRSTQHPYVACRAPAPGIAHHCSPEVFPTTAHLADTTFSYMLASRTTMVNGRLRHRSPNATGPPEVSVHCAPLVPDIICLPGARW